MSSRQVEGHCPDCGRPVEAGADLCACGFPLMFLQQDAPDAAVIKPSRKPAQDGDTDELPVVEAPPPRPAPPSAPWTDVPPAAPEGVVCASCDEVNPTSRTWCARCGASLRERNHHTEVLATAPAPRPRRRALLVGGAAAVVVLAAVGAGGWVLAQDAADPSGAEPAVGPLTIGAVTASATAPAGRDNLGREVVYEGDDVADGDLTTAWRVLDDGVGVELVLPLDGERTVTEVALIPGYAKTDPVRRPGQTSDRFEDNGRVTRVRWEFDDGQRHVQVIPTPTRDWARSTLDQPVTTESVRLVIEESQAGTREAGRTTAISEVEVVGR